MGTGHEEGGGGVNDLKEILLGELGAHCDNIDRLWAVIRVMTDGLLEENVETATMEKVFWHILNSLQDLKNEAQDICGEIEHAILKEAS